MSQAEQDRRMDYVEFGARDIETTRAFYHAVFGWRFTDYGPDYTSFSDGRLSGGFTTERAAGAGGPLVVLYAVNLEAVQAKIRAAGGSIVKDTFSFPGARRFHFSDPGGNQLAVGSDR